jgi:Holliday junction DNA helicase RuvB
LRQGFGSAARLELYSDAELEAIVHRTSALLGVELTPEGATEIARRSRGTPRLAIRLLRRVRDFVEVRGEGVVTEAAAREGLTIFGVDELGLDALDRRILETLCIRFAGRPVGLSTLAVSVGEEPETVEDVYEPFLLQAGLVMRTPRGRLAAPGAYDHLGLEIPAQLSIVLSGGGIDPSAAASPRRGGGRDGGQDRLFAAVADEGACTEEPESGD